MDHKENFPIYKIFVTTTLTISLVISPIHLTSSISGEKIPSETLIKEIKQQLYDEIKTELQDYVRQEIIKQIEQHYAKVQSDINDTDLSAKNTNASQGSLQALIKKTISNEIKILENRDLDKTIASGQLDPNLLVTNGYSKEILLASNNIDEPKHPEKKKPIRENNPEDLSITGEGEKAEAIERTLVQKGNMLLPKGTLQFEPSITWAHFSSNNIHIQGFSVLPVLVIGDISTRKIKRDIFINNYAFKYGLFNNFQTEVKIPMRYEHDRETDTSFLTEETKTGGGLGDIEFGFSRQVGWEKGFIPDLIASVNIKTPTARSYNKTIALGTGHWSFRTALIAAKSSDPTVIFGNLHYTYTLPRDVDGIGRVVPGETIGYSVGTAIALSYQTAINFSFDHSVSFKSKSAGRMVKGSFLNVASFKAGLNWAISEKSSVDLGVSFGITDDAPDASVTLRFPYVF